MFRWMPFLAVTVLAASVFAAPVPFRFVGAGRDWPQFLGDNRVNVSPDRGLLKAWPADGPRLLWKSDSIGEGYSSVVVAGDRVFSMGDRDGDTYAVALDRNTGRKQWATKVGKGATGSYSGSRGTPTFDGGHVYALGQAGDLVCLDVRKGVEMWRKNIAVEFGGQVSSFGYSEAPLIDGDRLICTPGGPNATMVALEKRTGKEVWRSAANMTAGYASIAVSKAGGIKQYVQMTAGGTIGVSAKDGAVLWSYTKQANTTANANPPLVLGDHVFSSVGYGKGGALLKLTAAGGKVEATELYLKTELQNRFGCFVVVGDHLYGDTDSSGKPFCAEWKTGAVKWSGPAKGSQGRSSMTLTYADGHLYMVYGNGYVTLVPATAKGHTEAGSFKLPFSTSECVVPPVVIGKRLYLRDKETVFCYDVAAK